jgi:hypothetical protein
LSPKEGKHFPYFSEWKVGKTNEMPEYRANRFTTLVEAWKRAGSRAEIKAILPHDRIRGTIAQQPI